MKGIRVTHTICSALLVALPLAVLGSGCGGHGGPTPVDREDIATAFNGVGEPLKLRFDVQPEHLSSVAVYWPASYSLPPGRSPALAPSFSVGLYEDEDSARKVARWIKSVSPASLRIVQRQNALLVLDRPVPVSQRTRLIDAMDSL